MYNLAGISSICCVPSIKGNGSTITVDLAVFCGLVRNDDLWEGWGRAQHMSLQGQPHISSSSWNVVRCHSLVSKYHRAVSHSSSSAKDSTRPHDHCSRW